MEIQGQEVILTQDENRLVRAGLKKVAAEITAVLISGNINNYPDLQQMLQADAALCLSLCVRLEKEEP